MPDESNAATEHALLQEITAPLATLPDDPLPEVAEVDFPVAMRGYDRLAVDAYVKRTSQLVAELQATRSPEAAVKRGLERVGEEVSGILQRAHEAASQITAQSRSEAEDRLERARQEATQITAAAERRLAELDTEADRIWAERQRIVDDAHQLAHQLLSLAQSAAERFPADEEPETTQEAPSSNGVVEEPAAVTEEDDVATTEERGGELATEEPGLDGATEEPHGELPTEEPYDQFAGDDTDVDSTRVMQPIRPSDSIPPPQPAVPPEASPPPGEAPAD
jgi:cell division septum initiation protein DivIVA